MRALEAFLVQFKWRCVDGGGLSKGGFLEVRPSVSRRLSKDPFVNGALYGVGLFLTASGTALTGGPSMFILTFLV